MEAIVYKEKPSMSKFDPQFWEIGINPEIIDSFSQEDALWYETKEQQEQRYIKEDKKRKILPLIMEIIENDLTDMQKKCIIMHFLYDRTHDEVAQALGISRRVVSQHIFGIFRHGKRVGGGIEKIKKICQKKCITI
ncbi:TPA: hypothetical protein ENS27_11220 [bacterium]|nr:hypothetical protein [bacterium]